MGITLEPVVWDRRFREIVDAGSLRQVGDGFGFPEGPVMLPDGYLVFSDISNDAIVRFSRPGRTGVFRHPSGGANGNTLDPRGRLVTCEAGRRRVTRTEPDGSITVLADAFEGKRLRGRRLPGPTCCQPQEPTAPTAAPTAVPIAAPTAEPIALPAPIAAPIAAPMAAPFSTPCTHCPTGPPEPPEMTSSSATEISWKLIWL